MRTVRIIAGFTFNVIGGVLLLGGILAVIFDQFSQRSISMTHGPAVLVGAVGILLGELMHPRLRKRKN